MEGKTITFQRQLTNCINRVLLERLIFDNVAWYIVQLWVEKMVTGVQ